MNVLDTVEISREITEVTYSGTWSDIIDDECQNSPIESLMNTPVILLQPQGIPVRTQGDIYGVDNSRHSVSLILTKII